MTLNITRFFLLVLLSLFAGTTFGTLVGYNPASLSASAYVEQQQNAIRSFFPILPIIGGLCVALTVGLAIRLRSDRRVCYLHIAVAILLVVAALVTRFGAHPINEIVMTWSAQEPAANWLQLRNNWWNWHIVRSVAGISALALTVVAVLASKDALVDTAWDLRFSISNDWRLLGETGTRVSGFRYRKPAVHDRQQRAPTNPFLCFSGFSKTVVLTWSV